MSSEHAITIDPICNGPPDSAHGGVAAGRLAELVDRLRASVRFHALIPIAEPMSYEPRPDGEIELSLDGRPIATVRSLEAHLDVEHFERLAPDVVQQAEQDFVRHWGRGQHPFPTCFGCGPGRHDGLGMALRSGSAPGHGVHAAAWTPELDGPVPAWLVWAALDCPSGFPAFVGMAPDRARVTGGLAVDIRHPVPGDGSFQILCTSPARPGARPPPRPRSSTNRAPTWRWRVRSGSKSPADPPSPRMTEGQVAGMRRTSASSSTLSSSTGRPAASR